MKGRKKQARGEKGRKEKDIRGENAWYDLSLDSVNWSTIVLASTDEPECQWKDKGGSNHETAPVHGDGGHWVNTGYTEDNAEKDDPEACDNVNGNTPPSKIERSLWHIMAFPDQTTCIWKSYITSICQHANYIIKVSNPIDLTIRDINTDDSSAHDSRPVYLTSKRRHNDNGADNSF